MFISKNVATRKGEREREREREGERERDGDGERERGREGVIEMTFRTRKRYPIEREKTVMVEEQFVRENNAERERERERESE